MTVMEPNERVLLNINNMERKAKGKGYKCKAGVPFIATSQDMNQEEGYINKPPTPVVDTQPGEGVVNKKEE